MVAALLRVSARAVPRVQFQRSFSAAAVAKKDLIQDLYLKELQGYKAPAQAKDAHVGQVKTFSAPAAPSVPELPSDFASALSAYDAAEPTFEAPAAAKNAGEAPEDAGKGNVDGFLAFLEKDFPKEEAHH